METTGQKRIRPESSGDNNSRPQKRTYEKLRDARKIAVQTSSPGIPPFNLAFSVLIPALSSGSIDVSAFIAARSFEITALQDSMRSSKAALAQRAFQDVPRSLRRRSASHNVKRVPRPLRVKAKQEMIADGTKAPTKVRGTKRLRMEKRRLYKRSVGDESMTIDEEETASIPTLKPRKVTKGKFAYQDKTWLPTHLYHSKRARIECRYRFSLPITPTEKSFRPTYRASHHSGFIAFDTSYFSTIFLHGTQDVLRVLLGMVIEPGSPAAGNRYSSGKRSCETTLYHSDQQFPQGMIGPAIVLWKAGQKDLHHVMLRVHPGMVEEVWEELHVCVKKVGEVKIEDARFEVGSIDFFGPQATEVLFAVLRVGNTPCSEVWNKLRGLRDTGNLPLGSVLDLDLSDPRTEYSHSATLLIKLSAPQWPAHIPGPAKLFDASSREAATKYIEAHTRGSLQKARNDLLNQGKPPTLPASDPIIPSLLLRRDSGAWTLLLPWSWVNDFWLSFMHYPQSRFGGIKELAQISFESKGMAFPEDWPGTRTGDLEGLRMAGQVKMKWERRPPGKRESWGRILKGESPGKHGDPFKCDWSLLFKEEVVVDDKISKIDKIRAQARAAMDPESSDEGTQFLLPPSYAQQLLTKKSPIVPAIGLSHALIPIRLRFLNKGNVSFRARIYRLPLAFEERQKWTDLMKKDIIKPSKENHPPCPNEQDLLGFVTSGNMSLSEGRGRAVGALSWVRADAEEDRWVNDKEFRKWCIVRDVGTDIGRLAKWEVND